MTSWWVLSLAFTWGIMLVSIVINEIKLRRQAMAAGIPGEEVPIKPLNRTDILGAVALFCSGGALRRPHANTLRLAQGVCTSYF